MTAPKPTTSTDSHASWSEEDSEQAFALLGDRFINAVQRYKRSQRRERVQAEIYTVDGHELSIPQVDALEAVATARALRMNELASQLGVDPSTATRTTAPLVDLGLLERQTDPSNRRYVVLRCSKKGDAAVRRLREQRRTLMRAVLGGMEPSRRLLLTELLEEYLDLFDEQQADPRS